MNAEVICVGTELLMGNTLNTHATYLSEKCTALGISMMYHSVVGDNPNRLKELFLNALNRSDLILLAGGLGPTEDDLTKEIIADAMGLELVRDEKAWKMLNAYFARQHRKMTQNNDKQALVPAGCKVLYNENGTAPGILIEKNGKIVVILPGPPIELHPMFENQVIPYLKGLSDVKLVSRMIKVTGIGESMLESEILDLIDAQTNPTIATYSKTGEVHIRVTASANTEDEALNILLPTVDEICHRFGNHVFTTDESVTLETAIAKKLIVEGKTLTTAESCTGGLLSGRIINVSGVSSCYKEGYITYSNESKQKILKVSSDILETQGAVSEECARAMCKGAMEESGADYALVTTGVAGPEPSEGKPVGLVYIGIGTPKEIIVKGRIFQGTRELIRERTVAAALSALWLNMNEENK